LRPSRPQTVRLSTNLQKLEILLDERRLNAELQDLKAIEDQKPLKSYFSNIDMKSVVAAWMEQNETHNILGTYLDLLPHTSCATGAVLFFRLQHSVNALPELAATIRQLRVLERAQCWEMCRSLMIVFNWYACSGPETANRLTEIHQSSGKSNAHLFCLISPYCCLNPNLSRIKQISVKESFLRIRTFAWNK
jgi:hypothetical protein